MIFDKEESRKIEEAIKTERLKFREASPERHEKISRTADIIVASMAPTLVLLTKLGDKDTRDMLLSGVISILIMSTLKNTDEAYEFSAKIGEKIRENIAEFENIAIK